MYMGYSIQEAKLERAYDISRAKEGVDAPEKLRFLADRIAKEGDDELAHQLLREATIIENMYDEKRDNDLS